MVRRHLRIAGMESSIVGAQWIRLLTPYGRRRTDAMKGSPRRRLRAPFRAVVGACSPYRLTLKILPLLFPAAVITVTLAAPTFAVMGTVHLI